MIRHKYLSSRESHTLRDDEPLNVQWEKHHSTLYPQITISLLHCMTNPYIKSSVINSSDSHNQIKFFREQQIATCILFAEKLVKCFCIATMKITKGSSKCDQMLLCHSKQYVPMLQSFHKSVLKSPLSTIDQ